MRKIVFDYKLKERFKLAVTGIQLVSDAKTFEWTPHSEEEPVVFDIKYAQYLVEYLDQVLPYPEYTGLTKPVEINI